MKPIYFPFTFVSEPLCESFGRFFSQFVLYHPSEGRVPEAFSKWADQGRVELRAPLGGQEERLEALVLEYRDWLERQRGSETTFFKTRLFDSLGEDTVPMFSENSTSRIKADIKRGRVAPDKPKPDPLFAVRLFLLIAHAFDQQQSEINRDLKQFRDLEKDLFTVMRGDDDFSEESEKAIDRVIAEDTGRHKTGQRVSAWLKLFEQDPVGPDESGCWLLLTTSEAVLDQIPEYYADMPPAYSTGPVSLDDISSENVSEIRAAVAENLDRLAKGTMEEDGPVAIPGCEPGSGDLGSLKIFAFPGKSPLTLFQELQTDKGPQGGQQAPDGRKTFVAKFECL